MHRLCCGVHPSLQMAWAGAQREERQGRTCRSPHVASAPRPPCALALRRRAHRRACTATTASAAPPPGSTSGSCAQRPSVRSAAEAAACSSSQLLSLGAPSSTVWQGRRRGALRGARRSNACATGPGSGGWPSLVAVDEDEDEEAGGRMWTRWRWPSTCREHIVSSACHHSVTAVSISVAANSRTTAPTHRRLQGRTRSPACTRRPPPPASRPTPAALPPLHQRQATPRSLPNPRPAPAPLLSGVPSAEGGRGGAQPGGRLARRR